MSPTAGSPDPTPSGVREQAILTATADLIHERGWERLAMRTVAERAGVSLTTIYDQWPTKVELALAAVQSVTLSQEWTLDAMRELLMGRPNLVLCLLSIQRSDPKYRSVIRDRFTEPMLGPLRDAVMATGGGGLDEDTATIIALIGPALLFVRGVVLEQEVTIPEMVTISSLVDRLAQSFEQK